MDQAQKILRDVQAHGQNMSNGLGFGAGEGDSTQQFREFDNITSKSATIPTAVPLPKTHKPKLENGDPKTCWVVFASNSVRKLILCVWVRVEKGSSVDPFWGLVLISGHCQNRVLYKLVSWPSYGA